MLAPPCLPPAMEHAVRRLVQQAAPPWVVLEACQRMPEWHEVDGQARLLQAIALDPDSAAVDPSYRQRLLKGLVTALQKLDVELQENLLETYLAGLSGLPAPSPWSVQTYEVERGQRLRLRVHKGIGGGTETGGMVWPAALVLCAWLMRLPSFAGLEILELGAGTGLCGLALAQCCRVRRCTLTDVVPATLSNMLINVGRLPPAAAPCRVAALDWCEPEAFLAAEERAPDLILGADLVYEPTLAAPLAATLAALLSRATLEARDGVTPRALVACVRRTETWDLFVRELAAHGLTHSDCTTEAHAAMEAAECPFWCAADEVARVRLLEVRVPQKKATFSVGYQKAE